jgi:hypothetical protein
MATLQEIADDLAREALAVAQDEHDPILAQITKVIGSSSNTLEEAFITALRIRRAAQRGRKVIEQRARKLQEQTTPSGDAS